jgi:hypothetical protein
MDKTQMPIGTPVVVIRDNGEALSTKTRSEPWQTHGGIWVVMVEGIAGFYRLDRVRPLESVRSFSH